MKIMEVPDLFELPFYTDAKVGYSYGTMVKYEKFVEDEGVLEDARTATITEKEEVSTIKQLEEATADRFKEKIQHR